MDRTKIADGPAPRTRPRDRGASILAAAAALFADHGYERVGLSEVARAVAVRPSAIYGHFASKRALLHATILAEFAPAEALIAELSEGSLEAILRGLAAYSLDHRRLGVLWQREARHLDDEQRAELRAHVRAAVTVLAGLLRRQRTELAAEPAGLLVQCLFSVMLSTAQHRLTLPRPEYDLLILDLGRAILAVRLPTTTPKPPSHVGRPVLSPQSRRESLLDSATSLFAARGFEATSVEEIGAAAGIAGPSVYNHFASKYDLLAVVVTRAIGGLRIDLSRVLRSCSDATAALVGLSGAYRAFVFAHSALVDVLVSEVHSLSEDHQNETRQAIREYVDEWVHLVCVTTGMPDVPARVRVIATLSMINDVARTPHLRAIPGIDEVLEAAAARLLLSGGV